jgi:hypothetical protein
MAGAAMLAESGQTQSSNKSKMTDEQMREVAGQWLSPVDQIFADLIDKSYRMTAGAFQIEVEQVIERIPQLFFMLDKRALETSLENEIGAAIVKSLEREL